MNLLIHAFCPLILFGSTGCGPETPPKGRGVPPIEKTAASEAFTEIQVLVNGEKATNGIVTVRKGAKTMSITVTMKVDTKKFGPLDSFDAETNKYEDSRWLKTRTSNFIKPVVMADGKLKVTFDLLTPSKRGENQLRIRAWGEKHEKPIYVAGGVINVVEEE